MTNFYGSKMTCKKGGYSIIEMDDSYSWNKVNFLQLHLKNLVTSRQRVSIPIMLIYLTKMISCDFKSLIIQILKMFHLQHQPTFELFPQYQLNLIIFQCPPTLQMVQPAMTFFGWLNAEQFVHSTCRVPCISKSWALENYWRGGWKMGRSMQLQAHEKQKKLKQRSQLRWLMLLLNSRRKGKWNLAFLGNL